MVSMTREEAITITDEVIAEVIKDLEADSELSDRERQSKIDAMLEYRATNIEMLLSYSVEENLAKLNKLLSKRSLSE
jgi:hypothetical protein